MKELSHAILNSKKSKIRALFDLLIQSGPGAISFGIGQPDFTSPDFVNEGIIKALRDHKTQYAPALGIPPLRQLAAEKFRNENNLKWAQRENIMITNGGSQGLTLAFAVLSNPGDEMILDSPNFISYFYLCEYYHIKCKEVPRKNDLSPDLEGIRKAITPKTKFILVNSPNNPTGYVYTKDEMDELVQIVLDNDLYLISDEVYEHFLYNGEQHISPASYDGMKGRTITVNAMSKTYGATGLRLGYMVADEKIIPHMEKYIQYTTAGVNHPVQYGAIKGFLNIEQADFKKITERYNKKRLFCIQRLREMNFEVAEPQGAFYIMPRLNSSWDISADKFSEQLVREQHVACVPGDAFGTYSADRLRISYATSDQNLTDGFNRIETFLRDHGYL